MNLNRKTALQLLLKYEELKELYYIGESESIHLENKFLDFNANELHEAMEIINYTMEELENRLYARELKQEEESTKIAPIELDDDFKNFLGW